VVIADTPGRDLRSTELAVGATVGQLTGPPFNQRVGGFNPHPSQCVLEQDTVAVSMNVR